MGAGRGLSPRFGVGRLGLAKTAQGRVSWRPLVAIGDKPIRQEVSPPCHEPPLVCSHGFPWVPPRPSLLNKVSGWRSSWGPRIARPPPKPRSCLISSQMCSDARATRGASAEFLLGKPQMAFHEPKQNNRQIDQEQCQILRFGRNDGMGPPGGVLRPMVVHRNPPGRPGRYRAGKWTEEPATAAGG